MKRTAITLLSALAGVNGLYSSTSDVVSLTASNWNTEVINSDKLWMVEFYAPWCGHCKSLAPHWEKAATQLKGFVSVGAVDMTTDESVGRPYDVKGFPTLKFFGFDKTKPLDYQEARETDAIRKFALRNLNRQVSSRAKGEFANSGKSKSSEQKSTGQQQQQQKKTEYKAPATDKDVIVLDDTNFDSTVYGSKDIWLVEFYAPWCGHCKKLEPEWNEAATALKGKIKMAKYDADGNKGKGSALGVKGFPTIKYWDYGLPKNDKNSKTFEGQRSAAAFIAFGNDLVEEADIVPEVYEITSQAVFDEHCQGQVICAISFLPNIYETNAKDRNALLELHGSLAKSLRKQRLVNFWSEAGNQLDLERSLNLGFGFPAMVIVSPTKKMFATMRGSYSQQGLGKYLRAATGGNVPNLEPFPKTGMTFKKASKWDGKDATPIVEEPLEDL